LQNVTLDFVEFTPQIILMLGITIFLKILKLPVMLKIATQHHGIFLGPLYEKT